MTPREFNNLLIGWRKREEQFSKERWEIARYQVIYLTYASGNVRKGKTLKWNDFPTPHDKQEKWNTQPNNSKR